MSYGNKRALFCLFITGICIFSFSNTTSIRNDMDSYYQKMDESFTRLCKSAAFKSTTLSAAEKMFVKELRKNQAYYMLMRSNSKGMVISEAVRGKKVERPNNNIERENWFRAVKKDKEPFYTVIRDDDRGRYYLIWSKPIIKNNSFVGAVAVKIDLWDSFYEFSNSVYYPFLVRLNGMSLFSHKWNNDFTHKEDRLTIPGINRISVRFIPEKKPVASIITGSNDTTSSGDAIVAATDTNSQKDTSAVKTFTVALNDSANQKLPAKKGSMATLLFIFLAVITIGTVSSILVVSRIRKKAFLKKLDEE